MECPHQVLLNEWFTHSHQSYYSLFVSCFLAIFITVSTCTLRHLLPPAVSLGNGLARAGRMLKGNEEAELCAGFSVSAKGPTPGSSAGPPCWGVCKVMKGSCQEHICHLFVKNPTRRPVRSCDAGRAPPGLGGSLSCLSLAPSADKSQARRGATLWRSCCPLPAVWPHPVPCRAGLWSFAPAIPFVHSL